MTRLLIQFDTVSKARVSNKMKFACQFTLKALDIKNCRNWIFLTFFYKSTNFVKTQRDLSGLLGHNLFMVTRYGTSENRYLTDSL